MISNRQINICVDDIGIYFGREHIIDIDLECRDFVLRIRSAGHDVGGVGNDQILCWRAHGHGRIGRSRRACSSRHIRHNCEERERNEHQQSGTKIGKSFANIYHHKWTLLVAA